MQYGRDAIDRFVSFSLTFMPDGGTHHFNVSGASADQALAKAAANAGAGPAEPTCDSSQPDRKLYFYLPAPVPAASKVVFYVTAQCDPDMLDGMPVPICLDPAPRRVTGGRDFASVGLKDIKLYGWPAHTPPAPPAPPPRSPAWRQPPQPLAPATSDDPDNTDSDSAAGDPVRQRRSLLQIRTSENQPAQKYSDLPGFGTTKCAAISSTVQNFVNAVTRNTSELIGDAQLWPKGGFVAATTVRSPRILLTEERIFRCAQQLIAPLSDCIDMHSALVEPRLFVRSDFCPVPARLPAGRSSQHPGRCGCPRRRRTQSSSTHSPSL